jgi:hypothetical protein
LGWISWGEEGEGKVVMMIRPFTSGSADTRCTWCSFGWSSAGGTCEGWLRVGLSWWMKTPTLARTMTKMTRSRGVPATLGEVFFVEF